MVALGGPSVVNELTQVTVRKAAELVVLAEATRAAMLNGVLTDITALIRIEGEARRACRALGLKIEPVSKTAARVQELRHERWAEQERRKAAQAAAKAREAATNMEPPDGEAAE